ncbi:Hypothetical protein, putative [Bodo saltans]|uniref:Uncharacterized protein n=1 Tax=Bodo saltans TaxID=75058 RepID=A0A0S4IP54_BODSA|nr:Hypothetical protein, putative [Bodo saltans]|eukprot:CUF80458.1 Hypothetical protein, putative [Bodo saltans]
MDRALLVESERRLKLESDEVRSRLLIGQQYTRRATVHFNRSARAAAAVKLGTTANAALLGNGGVKMQPAGGRDDSATLSASSSPTTMDLSYSGSQKITATAVAPAAARRFDKIEGAPEDTKLFSKFRALSPIDVEEVIKTKRATVLGEAERIRRLHLDNVRSLRLQQQAAIVDSSAEELAHMKKVVELRKSSVETFTSKLKRELAARLQMIAKSGDNHQQLGAGGNRDALFLSPQPERRQQRRLLSPLKARTPSPTSGNKSAATPPLLDAQALAEVTCSWIARTTSNEEEARKMADKALRDIQREVNLEARRQLRQAELTKATQQEEVVARNEMRRAVELAQAQTAASMRLIAAQRRTVHRVSEAETRALKLPPCMRAAAATFFSLSDLEAIMSKNVEATMRDVHGQRQKALRDAVDRLRMQLEAAKESQSFEHEEIRSSHQHTLRRHHASTSAQVSPTTTPRKQQQQNGAVAVIGTVLSKQPASVIARVTGPLPTRSGGALGTSVGGGGGLTTAAKSMAHRPIVIASLKQLLAQIHLTKSSIAKEMKKQEMVDDARKAAKKDRAQRLQNGGENGKHSHSASSGVPTLAMKTLDLAAEFPSSSFVEGLISALSSEPLHPATLPAVAPPSPTANNASSSSLLGTTGDRSSPTRRSLASVTTHRRSQASITTTTTGAPTTGAADALDLSHIRCPLTLPDLVLLRDCVAVIKPKFTSIKFGSHAFLSTTVPPMGEATSSHPPHHEAVLSNSASTGGNSRDTPIASLLPVTAATNTTATSSILSLVGILEIAMDISSLTSLDIGAAAAVTSKDNDDPNRIDSTLVLTEDAVRGWIAKVVRRNREISLLQRGLKIAQQKLSQAIEQESNDELNLPVLRKRLAESLKMLVSYYEEWIKGHRALLRLRQEAAFGILVLRERSELREWSKLARDTAHNSIAQGILFEEEQRERQGLESLYERNVHLVFKENVTMKKSFRRLSRKMSIGMSLRRGVSSMSLPAGTQLTSGTTVTSVVLESPFVKRTSEPSTRQAQSGATKFVERSGLTSPTSPLADDLATPNSIATALPSAAAAGGAPPDGDGASDGTTTTNTCTPVANNAPSALPLHHAVPASAAAPVTTTEGRATTTSPEAFGEAALSMRVSPRGEHSREVSRRASSPFGEFATSGTGSVLIAAAAPPAFDDGALSLSALTEAPAMAVSGLGGASSMLNTSNLGISALGISAGAGAAGLAVSGHGTSSLGHPSTTGDTAHTSHDNAAKETSAALNPKPSELAEIDEDVQRRMNVHSSSAASRPRQVMFHQSPPPSRQRMD